MRNARGAAVGAATAPRTRAKPSAMPAGAAAAGPRGALGRAAPAPAAQATSSPTVQESRYGALPDGTEIRLFTLDNGLRLLRLAIDTHLITAHHALPLLIERPDGLLIEVTDGTAEYNAQNYRLQVKAAMDAWIAGGYRNEVDQMNAFINHVGLRDMTLWKQRLLELRSESERMRVLGDALRALVEAVEPREHAPPPVGPRRAEQHRDGRHGEPEQKGLGGEAPPAVLGGHGDAAQRRPPPGRGGRGHGRCGVNHGAARSCGR